MRRFLAILLLLPLSTSAAPRWWKRIILRQKEENRGMRYDRGANEAAALSALELLGQELKWFRLDDSVMGGQSETTHSSEGERLHFQGIINTDGGGFCSIRAKLQQGFDEDVTGIRLKFIGDGKTYKVTLSNGKSSIGESPSWQTDLPTLSGKEQTVVLPLSDLTPSFGGRPSSRPSAEELAKYKLDPSSIQEIGLMLSLQLSDGTPNPKNTFGEGVFPFSLQVKSIEPVRKAN